MRAGGAGKTGRRTLDPGRAASRILRALRGLADERRARAGQRYFKEPAALLGIDAPTLHRVETELAREIAGRWTVREAVRFCEALLRDPHLEVRGLGYLVVARYAGEAGPDLLPRIKRWLSRSCGNWALVDSLAPSVPSSTGIRS